MNILTKSRIKMILICTGIFLSGGVVAVAAVATYGSTLPDKEYIEKRLDNGDTIDNELNTILDSKEDEA